MKTLFKLAATAITCLCLSQNAYAASGYTAQSHVALEVVGISDANGNQYDVFDLPTGLSIGTEDYKDAYYSTTGEFSFADGIANTLVDTGLVIVDAQVIGDTDAIQPFAQAYSDAIAEASMIFSNQSSQTYFIEMALEYEFSGEAIIGNPADESANVVAYIDVAGLSYVPDLLSVDTESEGLDSFESPLTSVAFSFSLDAGQEEEIYTDILVSGESSSVSAVPLPASIFLMGPAIFGLFVRRKLS